MRCTAVSNLLWLSGGLLELGKCLFHQIHFNSLPDGTPMMCAGTFGDPIQVHNELTNQPVTIPVNLQSLDPWESQLFLELLMEVDCYEFIQMVNTQSISEAAIQLIMVSKGSDDSGSMRLCWIISLLNGRHLAQCSGPAFGPYTSSFRAEGYGFLSIS
jgi:hypothetical protein